MTRNQQIGVGVTLGVMALLGMVFVINPVNNPLLPPCLFHRLTGLYCPGCGSTRAIHHLLHGQWQEALRLNALVTILGPLLVGGLAWERLSRRSVRPWSFNQLSPTLVWALVGVVLLFGIVRNIPCYPFTLLVP